MPISPKAAVEQTRNALAAVFGETEFALTPLNINADPKETMVLRAKQKGAPVSYICKVGEQKDWVVDRLTTQAEAQHRAAERMQGQRYKVPAVITFDPEQCCLVQEDAKGETLSSILRQNREGEISQALMASTAWLTAYHAATLESGAFDPDPHFGWVRHQPMSEALDAHLERQLWQAMEDRAQRAKGGVVKLCQAHGDFHPAQVVLRQNGDVYGLDFYSQHVDVALRDLYHLGLHVAFRMNLSPNLGEADVFRALAHGYGDVLTAVEVIAFWDLFMRAKQIADFVAKPVAQRRHRLDGMVDALRRALSADYARSEYSMVSVFTTTSSS